MPSLLVLIALAVAADPTPIYLPGSVAETGPKHVTQDQGSMAGMAAPGKDSMSSMNMNGMASMNGMGMAGMSMGSMTMSPGMIAMGMMAFMNVMGSRAEPGCLMRILGCDMPTNNMGNSGMAMNGKDAMSAMKMDGNDSREVLAERAKLAPEERRLVDAQEWCPITGMRLGSMGPPIKIILKEQTVFLCCESCPAAARADPDRTLAEVARLTQRKAQGQTEADGKSSMGAMGSMGSMAMNGMGSMPGMNGMADMNHPGFSISGWTDMSFTASSASHSNLPMGFNYLANQFLLQQNWLRLDWAIDEHATAPSFGFRSDWILPGSDYRFTLPRGIFNEQLTADNGMPNTYGIDPFQFYGEAFLPGIADGMDVKVGRWCMLNGIEMTEATMNLFASHSYTFLADPFTHTGILTTTRLTKQLVAQAAITTGSDIFFDSGAAATFVGAVQWFSPSERTSLRFATVLGPGRFNVAANWDNRNLFDVVFRQRFGKHFYYAVEGLYGYEFDVPNIGTADWWGIVQYLTYEVNAKVAPSLRLEFFDDVQGERTGFPGLYTAVTANVYYRPRQWLTLRPEIRYDNSEGRAFEGRHGLFTATTDVILQW